MGIDRGSGVRGGESWDTQKEEWEEWGQTGRVRWKGERMGMDRRSGV